VVISVPERSIGENYASVTSATRELADKFGLRVIIDGSPNSIPPDLKATGREIVIDIERMSRDVLENISEFKDLISFLKKHHLDDGVWEVFGGTPSHYIQLMGIKAEFSDTQMDTIVDEIKGYALYHLGKALNNHIVESSPNTKAIVKVFREKKTTKIPKADLEAQGLLLDYPNKVFREVYRNRFYIIPSTPAISLIISNSITNDDEVEKLWKALFAK
jgi:predicted Zn-dependent protease with MMP-like domain